MTVTPVRRRDETREMRLVSKLISLSPAVSDESLPQFLAARRRPNHEAWRTWDEITWELKNLTGEIFTDVSLRRWGKRYGIPEGTALAGGQVTPDDYAQAMREAGIALT